MGLVDDSGFDKRLMAVDFIRSTRNIWFAAFRGLTQAEVSAILAQVIEDAENLDDLITSLHAFTHETAPSKTSTIIVVQLYRQYKPLPGGLMDMIRHRINVFHYSGSVDGTVPEYEAEAAEEAAAAAAWSEAGAATPEQDAAGGGSGIDYHGNDEFPPEESTGE